MISSGDVAVAVFDYKFFIGIFATLFAGCYLGWLLANSKKNKIDPSGKVETGVPIVSVTDLSKNNRDEATIKPEWNDEAKERLHNAAEYLRKKKEAERAELQAKADAIKCEFLAFRGIGEDFVFCGIIFTVETIRNRPPFPPAMVAAYRGGSGKLERELFEHWHLPALIKQNEDRDL
jgi:hypothetical protein